MYLLCTRLQLHLQGHSSYLRMHTGQHSPSTNEGLAQATGGHVIWWHTILDSCKNQIQIANLQGPAAPKVNVYNSLWLGTTWQVHLVQLSTTQSSLSSNRRPSCQHMFFSLVSFILPRASFMTVFSSVWTHSNRFAVREETIQQRLGHTHDKGILPLAGKEVQPLTSRFWERSLFECFSLKISQLNANPFIIFIFL